MSVRLIPPQQEPTRSPHTPARTHTQSESCHLLLMRKFHSPPSLWQPKLSEGGGKRVTGLSFVSEESSGGNWNSFLSLLPSNRTRHRMKSAQISRLSLSLSLGDDRNACSTVLHLWLGLNPNNSSIPGPETPWLPLQRLTHTLAHFK